MANCKDNCIHYPVCMYGDLTEYKTEQILKDDCDDYMSNDVVPKSEVERLRFNLEAVLGEIPETKREVAMEIFEEIEKCAYYHPQLREYIILEKHFADLKKKYTEGEHDE